MLNNNPLLHGYENSLISTARTFEFGVNVQDVSNNHGGEQYIHAVDRVVSMSFGNALMYVTFQEPTNQEIYNLSYVVFTKYLFINKKLEVKVVSLEDDEVEKDPTYETHKGKVGIIPTYRAKSMLKDTTHMASNFISLTPKNYFKSQIPHLNPPRLTEDYYANTLFYLAKGIGGKWYYQIFWGKKYLFGSIYGMAKERQGGNNIENFNIEYSKPIKLSSEND